MTTDQTGSQTNVMTSGLLFRIIYCCILTKHIPTESTIFFCLMGRLGNDLSGVIYQRFRITAVIDIRNKCLCHFRRIKCHTVLTLHNRKSLCCFRQTSLYCFYRTGSYILCHALSQCFFIQRQVDINLYRIVCHILHLLVTGDDIAFHHYIIQCICCILVLPVYAQIFHGQIICVICQL